MAQLPLEPRIGRMIVASQKYGCAEEVCIIAASISSIRSVFVRPRDEEYEADIAHEKFKDYSSDFQTLLNVYRAYKQFGSEEWCHKFFLSNKVLIEIDNVKNQLKDIISQFGISGSSPDSEKITKAVSAGLVENIFQKNKGCFRGINKRRVYIHPSSVLFKQKVGFMVAASVVETTKPYARNCALIKSKWITEIAPQLRR
jgi:HrpA-like RNA helicase